MDIRDDEVDRFAGGGSHMQMWPYVRLQTSGSFRGLMNKTKEQLGINVAFLRLCSKTSRELLQVHM